MPPRRASADESTVLLQPGATATPRDSITDEPPQQQGMPIELVKWASRFGLAVGVFAVAYCVVLLALLTEQKLERGKHQKDAMGSADYEPFHKRFLEFPTNESASMHLKELTKEPHIAGSAANYDTAMYMLNKLREYGWKAHLSTYKVLLSYPLSRSLALLEPTAFTAALQEGVVSEDPYSSNPRSVPTFHGYSPSGDVTAKVVYANYGRTEDFEQLAKLGINCSGLIVLTRYSKIFRGDKVKVAASYGAAAVLIYNDPEDYAANNTEGAYPDSWWLPPTGAQRGSVYTGVGDPLTPGWPATETAERLLNSDSTTMLPPIPSLPISYSDAKPFLEALGGLPRPAVGWHGGLNLTSYNLGPGPAVARLQLEMNTTLEYIHNVIAQIDGSEEPDRMVLLGNHRDAWVFGAVDPNSGTAAMLEIARGYGQLLAGGWRPRRSIVLCSWDMEEYGLVGSTEWAEDNLAVLSQKAVVYLNVDSAVAGPGFSASATPNLDSCLQDTAKQVADPDNATRSVYDQWLEASLAEGLSGAKMERLGGGGSDFAPLVQHVGVSGVDMRFGSDDYPVYHSIYDNYHWMEKFGDPLFHRHVACAQMWGLMGLTLADAPVLPMDYTAYASELEKYVRDVKAALGAAPLSANLTAAPLEEALPPFAAAAESALQEAQTLSAGRGPVMERKARDLNDRLMQAERAFLEGGGLRGRPWYRHLVYGPPQDNNYGTLAFPGFVDALDEASKDTSDAGRWEGVQHEVHRAARAIERAAKVLNGALT